MSDDEYSDEDMESDSDLELQEAFSKGLLKSGLNIETTKKKDTNDVEGLKMKLSDIMLKLDWIERLDLISDPAPLAPEIASKLQEEELKHEAKLNNLKRMNQQRKKKILIDKENPALNEFRRETIFHRQAQAAVLRGIPKLKALGVKTKRPDDYFAEMAKSDEHMQRVREELMRKQHVEVRKERVKQQRHLRKVGKQVQIQAKIKQASEKRQLNEEIKKYRKGIRKDLDFLDDKKKQNNKSVEVQGKGPGDKRLKSKRKFKDEKFGYGGQKRGLKKNTKDSFNFVNEYNSGGKGKKHGGKGQKHGGRRGGEHKVRRPGKVMRIKMKAKRNSKRS